MDTPRFRPRRPSPAMCVATIALIAAVGGTAFAAGTINGSSIKDHSISGVKLRNQAVGTAQLKDYSVQARDLQNGSVTTSKLKSNAVTGAKIAPGAVGASDLAKGSVSSTAIQNGAVTRAALAADARVPHTVVRTSAIIGVLDGALGDAQAQCNPGEALISGGVAVVSPPKPGISIMASRPEPFSGTPNRWQGLVSNGSGGTIQIQAYAVCAVTS